MAYIIPIILCTLFIFSSKLPADSPFPSHRLGFSSLQRGIKKIIVMLRERSLAKKNQIITAKTRLSDSDDLCQEEQNFIEQRLVVIKNALQSLCKKSLSLEKIPRIALCLSGGGFRAMLTSLGFLSQAEKNGLLSAVSHIASLSGSTWAVACWIASKKNFDELIDHFTYNLKQGLDSYQNLTVWKIITKNLIKKTVYNQPISANDLYGAFLVHTLLGLLLTNALQITLSEAHRHVKPCRYPFALYSCIQGQSRPYQWFEINQFESGSIQNAYVPTAALGKTFHNGISHDTAREPTLGSFLGIFGSAFHVNIHDLFSISSQKIQELKTKMSPLLWKTLKMIVRKLVLESDMANIRFFPSYFSHFVKSNEERDTHFSLIDAGIDFNIPLPPLLRKKRAIDIIIILDVSAEISGAPELKKAFCYAQKNNVALPYVNWQDIDQKIVNVLQNEDYPESPVIIYIPRIKHDSISFDPEECIKNYGQTYNFSYTPEQAACLIKFGQNLLNQAMHAIVSTICSVIEKEKKN